ncbi:hypothetical protein EFA69_05470 [Rufibacter immobilis]|uniref:Uncharacterized protein n=1 Tax=Rufibacter immobilis TaxID=1348778 RepID=A0A3M9N3S1_9BACT|nr:hypothetical protein [Rufibacter immobilis]RNI31957.1 hypothetical protein EFA69_05470 [Rufibacter immobilis]
MRPLKISIKGDYYDCQIYRGRLYLWDFDGGLKVYDWTSIIQSLIKKETDKIAFTFSFLDGNYLYKSSLIELFKDKDFKQLLLKKFQRLENKIFEITQNKLEKFLIGEQETPTGILPTDTEIYSNQLYFIHDEGLFSGSVHRAKSEKYPVSSRPVKLWDCNLLSIKANKYPQIALSGGDEGLFELNTSRAQPENLKKVETKKPIYQVSSEHSSFSNYSYLNIYNTSLIKESFLATFKWSAKLNPTGQKDISRNFEEKITDKFLFKTNSNQHFVSWGIADKIYKARNGGFEIIKFNNYANEEKGEEKFQILTSLNLQAWKGEVTNGGTAYFGNIVECENALIVILSNNQTITIPGPITRWRVYPRSINYENHLHVILDESIDIYSFNQDYFLNQEEKAIGIQFRNERSASAPRGSYFDDTDVSFFNDTDESLFDDPDLPF